MASASIKWLLLFVGAKTSSARCFPFAFLSIQKGVRVCVLIVAVATVCSISQWLIHIGLYHRSHSMTARHIRSSESTLTLNKAADRWQRAYKSICALYLSIVARTKSDEIEPADARPSLLSSRFWHQFELQRASK